MTFIVRLLKCYSFNKKALQKIEKGLD
jgi:hypothetical protein